MTTPRQNAELAALYFADDTLKCWARCAGTNSNWVSIPDPTFSESDLEYFVGHEPPPPKPAEQTVTDALRLAVKSAAPYSTATVGVSRLNEAADTIDTLRAQLAEAQKDAERGRWLIEHAFQYANVSLGSDLDGNPYVSIEPRFYVPEPAGLEYENEEWSVTDLRAAIDAAKGGADGIR